MRKQLAINASLVLVTVLAFGGCVLPQGFVIVQPQPVVVSPPDDGAVAQVDVVTEADVTPVIVDEYYFVDGRYYYWHPGYNRYVVLRGEPPYGHRVLRQDRLVPRDRTGRPHPEAMSDNRPRQGQSQGGQPGERPVTSEVKSNPQATVKPPPKKTSEKKTP